MPPDVGGGIRTAVEPAPAKARVQRGRPKGGPGGNSGNMRQPVAPTHREARTQEYREEYKSVASGAGLGVMCTWGGVSGWRLKELYVDVPRARLVVRIDVRHQ